MRPIISIVVQGVDLEFPVDDTMFGCYKDRDSCVKRDLQGEVRHSNLPSNIERERERLIQVCFFSFVYHTVHI